MKHILITASTAFELKNIRTYLENYIKLEVNNIFILIDVCFHILESGVGVMSTTFNLLSYFNTHAIDFCLQVGLGGTFHKTWKLGEIVAIASDQYGDLGAESKDGFLSIFDLNLINNDSQIFKDCSIVNDHEILNRLPIKKAKAITVNATSGKLDTIIERQKKFNCDVESMEGLALHYVCTKMNVQYLQVRAISNYVEERNRAAWDIAVALEAIDLFFKDQFLEHIQDFFQKK